MKPLILTDEERGTLVAMAAGQKPEKKGYYAKALAKIEEGKLGEWNWASALLGNLWLSYHKAFLWNWGLVVLSILLSAVTRVCLGGDGGAPIVAEGKILAVVWLVEIALMGAFGNRLLFWSLRRKLKQGYLNLPNYKTTESGWIWATFWLAFGFSFVGGFLIGFSIHVALPYWLQIAAMRLLQFAMLPSLVLTLWKAAIRPIWDNYRVWRLSRQNSGERK